MVVVSNCTTTGADGNQVPNVNSNMCASGTAGTGICTSDVGGPLIGFSGLIGIASWNRVPCGAHPVNFTFLFQNIYLISNFYC
jgi:secreted trypsin-like serine protease